MKTPGLKDLYITLSELNNSFTHYSLVWNQFGLDYAEIFKNNPKTLTKDYFTENPYKRKHNIKFGELEAEHHKTHETLIKGIFLLIYTHFEGYLKDLIIFSTKVDDTIIPIENKVENGEEDFMLIDKIFNRIGIDKNLFSEEGLLTLDYIRLKRNRLIHSNAENISKSLNGIIKQHGDDLNRYWNNILPSKLQGIDFSDKLNVNIMTFSSIIDIINIIRGISLEIDKLVINKLTSIGIVEKVIIPSFSSLQHRKLKGIKFERLVSKYKRFCISEYAIEVNDEMVELLKSSIA